MLMSPVNSGAGIFVCIYIQASALVGNNTPSIFLDISRRTVNSLDLV